MSLINICKILVSSTIANPISGADGFPHSLAFRPGFIHSTTDKKNKLKSLEHVYTWDNFHDRVFILTGDQLT